jgi:hypothetical protein
MRITVEIVHKSQLPQLFTNRKWQMAPSICIGGNGGICEQLSFVNNEVIGKPAARASHGNVNEDNFDGSRQVNGNRSLFRRGGIGCGSHCPA